MLVKEEVAKLPVDKPVDKVDKPTLRERIHTEARKWLGKDASPSDLAPEDRACAESVSNIVRQVLPDFPLVTGTYILWEKLKKDRRFKVTLEAKPGCIIISPTGTGNGQIIGHTGIFTDKWVMSSDGTHGTWKENYTLDGWVQRYRKIGGFHVYFFEPQDVV